MKAARVAALAAIVLTVALYFALGGARYLSFATVKAQEAGLRELARAHPALTALTYFAAYVAVTGLSLPAAALLTLVGGALFGLLWGVLLVSFASSIGATLAFLVARFVFRDWVQQRFGRALRGVNAGVERDGAFYLFTLRLIPAIPFFVVNLVMGLTPMRAATFYWVSQLGMLAGTLVYVNAGTQLAAIASPADVASPALIGAFVLLGVFPLVAKKAVALLQGRRAYARWPRQAKFERNLVVIGAGSAGLVAAQVAATLRASVTLIERDRMGGECLNTGCVPSKALLKSARVLAQLRRAQDYGFERVQVEFDFATVMERVQRVVRSVAPHDSAERYSALGIECLHGEARLVSPWEVEVRLADGALRRLSTRAIVIATGARPVVPPIPGLEEVGYLTSDTVWGLRSLPQRLLVLGGGPVGCELAQAFARFGSGVTLVEMLPRLLAREDSDAAELLSARLRADGVDLRLEHRAGRFLSDGGRKVLVCEHAGEERRIEFDAVLIALGRRANTSGYGLEELGIATTASYSVETNAYLQTRYPNIYACGDVAGPYQFTHTASHQAWYAAVNALLDGWWRLRADYSVIPWATFTDPEVARVGLNESEARARRVPYEVSVFDLSELDRAIADEAAYGRVKVLTVPGKDRILGASIIGERAGEMIAEFVVAMRHGLGLNKVLGTIHVYPTLAEANRHVAGMWRKAHAPQALLRVLGRVHAWRRGERA